MSYCLYLRKSRADAEAEERGEGETLARHEKALLELAKRQRLNITEIYREVVSGETIAARPIMQRLLTEVESGLWEGVLVMEVERLARGDTVDQGIMAQTFKFSSTKIITPMKTYDPNNEFDEEYFEFGLFMSRREYKTINRRLQRGRAASVKEGKYVGNKAPYGYRRVKLEKEKGWTLEPIPEEADIVRKIFELYAVGEDLQDGSHRRLGVSLIVRRLNDLKVIPKNGADWVPASVHDILINPVYAGFVRWNWRKGKKKMVDGQVKVERPRSTAEETIVVPGLHPAIVDKEIFDKVQKLMLKNPPSPIAERSSIKNPLAGIIVCGKCGRRMVRRPYGARRAKDSLMCAATICKNVSCDLHLVEKRILDALTEWLAEYRLEWGEASPSKRASLLELKKKTEKQIAAELSGLEKQLGNVYDFLEKGVYTSEVFLERSRFLTEKIASLRAELIKVNSEIEEEEAREENRRNIIPKVERLLEVYGELTSPKEKNDLLKDVLEKAVYTKEKSARWHGSLDDFNLTLYPRLPKSLDY